MRLNTLSVDNLLKDILLLSIASLLAVMLAMGFEKPSPEGPSGKPSKAHSNFSQLDSTKDTGVESLNESSQLEGCLTLEEIKEILRVKNSQRN